MDPETELGEEASPLPGVVEAEEDANAPPETIAVEMRGRPARSKNKANAENPIIVSESPPQPDPMYTALMKRLDAMDGMLAKRETEIAKKGEGTAETKEDPIEGGKGYITPIESAGFQGAI